MTIDNYSGCDDAAREALIALLKQLTNLARQDVYAVRKHKLDRKTGSKAWGYYPERHAIGEPDIMSHLTSEGPHIGIYPMTAGSDVVQIAVLDLDDHDGLLDWDCMASIALRVRGLLEQYGMQPLCIRSGGGRGVHIWLAWEEPQPAAQVRRFLQSIIWNAGYKDGTSGVLEGNIEVFPKQDALADTGGGSMGSVIALPFGRKSVLLGEDMLPVSAEAAAATELHHSKPVPDIAPEPDEVEDDPGSYNNANLDIVKDALQHVDADDRAVWVRMGYAIKSAFPGGDGYEAWREYSARSDKYDERECEKFWTKDAPPRRISLGSLFYAARKGGWKGKLKQSDFFVANGEIYWRKQTRSGPVATSLSSVVPLIVGDISHDDGSGMLQRDFIVKCGEELAVVPVKDFRQMEWLPALFGAKAIIRTETIKHKLAEAIQELSDNVEQRTVYTHLGWRYVNGEWMYFHAGGAIGKNGAAHNVDVKPAGTLADYVLTPEQNRKEAVAASLKLLDAGPAYVGYTLLAAAYRAPLSEFCPVDFSVYIAGDTGSFKSAITAIAQAHYGSAWSDGRRFPANFASTANALEKIAFTAKDAVLVVDDFAPTGTVYDVKALHKLAERLFRAQGNRTGRQRLNADISLRPETYPRGLIVASGEDIPAGVSLRARLVCMELGKGDIDKAVLIRHALHRLAQALDVDDDVTGGDIATEAMVDQPLERVGGNIARFGDGNEGAAQAVDADLDAGLLANLATIISCTNL